MKTLKASDLDLQSLETKEQERLAAAIEKVKPIVEAVRREGDKALIAYTKKFDKVTLKETSIRVSEEEINEAYKSLDSEVGEAIRFAKDNIKAFHEAQKPSNLSVERLSGVRLSQVFRPLNRIGAYVPGGRASYPSSVLMTIIPAKVAGVKEAILCTPPDADGSLNKAVLVAAREAGANAVFKAGGAQAVAAMAYGTKTIPRVDKIVGPGNIYVTAAKAIVSRDVAIDFLAGPSEILILADENADPIYIVSDMMAQAEHDPLARATLVTTSEKLAEEVYMLVEKELKTHARKEIMEKVIQANLLIIITNSVEEALNVSNRMAPEHLEIMVKEPRAVLRGVENAGAVFLGPYSPVAVGDYTAGSNHVLPTGRMARSYSGLSLRDYLKSIDVVECNKDGLKKLKKATEILAESESLQAHGRSVEARFKE
jgi:histidinol dehydrogenase